MKECYWCEKSCPDDEVGDFEMSADDEAVEVGWVCDHCIAAFLGKCGCEKCTAENAGAREAVRQYDLAHPAPTRDWGLVIGCLCFAVPLWLWLVLYILDWFY